MNTETTQSQETVKPEPRKLKLTRESVRKDTLGESGVYDIIMY